MRFKTRPSDHPMPSFTEEQKSTDGSTDARIFALPVHPMLY
jgi:hypothetical protein